MFRLATSERPPRCPRFHCGDDSRRWPESSLPVHHSTWEYCDVSESPIADRPILPHRRRHRSRYRSPHRRLSHLAWRERWAQDRPLPTDDPSGIGVGVDGAAGHRPRPPRSHRPSPPAKVPTCLAGERSTPPPFAAHLGEPGGRPSGGHLVHVRRLGRHHDVGGGATSAARPGRLRPLDHLPRQTPQARAIHCRTRRPSPIAPRSTRTARDRQGWLVLRLRPRRQSFHVRLDVVVGRRRTSPRPLLFQSNPERRPPAGRRSGRRQTRVFPKRGDPHRPSPDRQPSAWGDPGLPGLSRYFPKHLSRAGFSGRAEALAKQRSPRLGDWTDRRRFPSRLGLCLGRRSRGTEQVGKRFAPTRSGAWAWQTLPGPGGTLVGLAGGNDSSTGDLARRHATGRRHCRWILSPPDELTCSNGLAEVVSGSRGAGSKLECAKRSAERFSMVGHMPKICGKSCFCGTID